MNVYNPDQNAGLQKPFARLWKGLMDDIPTTSGPG